MKRQAAGRSGSVLAVLAVGVAIVGGFAVGADDGPVVVSTRVEPQTVGIGTPFRYYVRVESRGEAEVVMPLLVDSVGEFLIRDYGSSPDAAVADGAVVTQRWYELVGYEVGHHLIEGGSIAYRAPGSGLESVEVPEVAITIAGMIGDDADIATTAPRDIVGPVGVPRDRRMLWYLGTALLAVATIVALLFRWWRRRFSPPVVVERPAHEVALEALGKLRRARLLEDGRQPEFYVRLSAIVREYVERRFHVRAPEMTTEEFLRAAKVSRELPVEYRSRLGGFLGEADLVKFARHVPSAGQGERAFEAAEDFVTRTAATAEEHQNAAA